MAIDPTIALGIKAPPQIDPVALQTRAAQYRNLISEGQLRQQEITNNQEKLKQEQLATAKTIRAQNDEEGLRQALMNSDGKPENVISQALKNGVGPDAIEAYQKHVADVAKTTAETADKELPVKIDKNNRLLTLHDQYLQMSPQEQAQNWPAIYQQAVAIDPETAKHFSPDSPPTPAMVQASRALHMTQDYLLKQTAEKRAQEKATEEATAAADVHARSAAELPAVTAKATTEAAVAGRTAANPKLLSPEEQQKADEAAATLAQTSARDKATAEYQKGELATKQADIALKQKQFQAEYGGDAVKGWAATIKDNPDAASEVPAKLRTGVQQEFQRQTGLPFPKALSGPTKTQETAARNGLAALQQVAEDVKDPEIQRRLGPILGRLGNVEQDVGATAGLTPEAAAKAQRLRTNMRMMAMQEGRSVFGGRIPQQLMESFQSSSPNVKMEPGTLTGALQGMQDAGLRALDTADQERFGGKMRTREDRGIKPVEFGGGAKKIGSKAEYDALPKGSKYVDADGKTYTKQ